MTLPDEVRDRIISMRGMSVREIAKATGVSPSSVGRILRSVPDDRPEEEKGRKSGTDSGTAIGTPPQNGTTPRTRATTDESVPEPVPKPAMKTKSKTVYRNADCEIVVPRVTRTTTIEAMAEILQMAKSGYDRAAKQTDESKRTWMETSYLKIMRDVLTQMGRWCGLDGTIVEDARRETLTESDIEEMSLEDMMHVVGRL